MTERDQAIVESLQQFRALTRDQIAQLHFAGLKNPVTQANTVLLRLRRDGKVTCNTERRKYIYFPEQSIKKDSSKLSHYLALCDFYLECRKFDIPRRFTIEPKFEKGQIEPDIFMIWLGTPFFVEVQLSRYSSRQLKEKFSRYEEYFHGESWKELDWQPKDKPPVLPRVWMLSEQTVNIGTSFKFVQTRIVGELAERMRKVTK